MKNAVKVLIFTLVVLIACGGSLYFYLNYAISDYEYIDGTKSGTIEITSYNGTDKDVVIPKKIRGKEVAYIGETAFSKAEITSVEIPDTVISIGKNAFFMCANLETVKMSANVEKISEAAFYQCSALKSVKLPKTLKEMDGAIFLDCTQLALEVEEGGNFVYKDDVLFDKDFTTVYWVKPDKDLSNYQFPSSVTTFTSYLLSNHNELKSYTLPENLTAIPDCLFVACQNLETIVIPKTVKSIGNTVFMACMNLKSVTIPVTVTSIGKSNFPVSDADEMNDFVLKVYENSAGFNHAQENNINYEIIK